MGYGRDADRSRLTNAGRVVLTVIVVAAVVVTTAVTGKLAIGATMAVALVLITVLFSFARQPSRGPVSVAVAIAAAVLVFGVVLSVFKALDDPKMPWVAVAHARDGEATKVDWGLYVIETSDRVWIATAIVDPADNEVQKPATQLYWIPREEISEMRIGATTHADDALQLAWEACGELDPNPPSCGADPPARYREYVSKDD
jgi:hypothetical protein